MRMLHPSYLIVHILTLINVAKERCSINVWQVAMYYGGARRNHASGLTGTRTRERVDAEPLFSPAKSSHLRRSRSRRIRLLMSFDLGQRWLCSLLCSPTSHCSFVVLFSRLYSTFDVGHRPPSTPLPCSNVEA